MKFDHMTLIYKMKNNIPFKNNKKLVKMRQKIILNDDSKTKL